MQGAYGIKLLGCFRVWMQRWSQPGGVVEQQEVEKGIIPDGAVVGEGLRGRALVVVVVRSRVATNNSNIHL